MVKIGRPRILKDIKCGNCGVQLRPKYTSRKFCSYKCHVVRRHEHSYILKRFWSLVTKTGSCWEWNGVINKHGYGMFSVKMKSGRAHRFSWEIHNGKIPDGLCVLHKCDNRICVNPNHLFLGTRTDNAKDRDNKGRQKCGMDCKNAKLTNESVLEIRKIYKTGKMTMTAIAKMFHTGIPNVHNIVNRKAWKHI